MIKTNELNTKYNNNKSTDKSCPIQLKIVGKKQYARPVALKFLVLELLSPFSLNWSRVDKQHSFQVYNIGTGHLYNLQNDSTYLSSTNLSPGSYYNITDCIPWLTLQLLVWTS